MCPPNYGFSWTCAACQESSRFTVPYREDRWTDSDSRGQDFGPEMPAVLRCPSCASLQRVGDVDWAVRREFPEAQPPSEADYFEALDARLYTTRDEKLGLRLRAWWAGNDASRVEGARAQIRSREAQANLEALYELLCDDPSEALAKAEVARQLGRFDRALELTAGLSRLAQLRNPARTIAGLAGEGSSVVAKVPGSTDSWLRYTCPHCAQPGRVGEASGFWDHPRYDFDSQLREAHALRCGKCAGIFWRGDHGRTRSLRLERFGDGALAELGCALFLPLAIAVALFSPRGGGAVILGYFLLILATEVGELVRRRVYPDSLPLRDEDFETLLAAQDWSGAEEERWVRLSVFHARTESRSREGLDPNALALLSLLNGSLRDLWLEARIRHRAGDFEGARQVVEGLVSAEDESYAKRGERLLRELERSGRAS